MYGYTNDAGEPMMDGAAYRFEQELDAQYAQERHLDDVEYMGHDDDDEESDPETCQHGDLNGKVSNADGVTTEYECIHCYTRVTVDPDFECGFCHGWVTRDESVGAYVHASGLEPEARSTPTPGDCATHAHQVRGTVVNVADLVPREI